MMSFMDFVNIGTQKRHMHPVGRDVSSHPKHPGRFVPHMHRAKLENVKLKRLKEGNSRKEILTRADIKELKDVYKFALNANHPVKLGNTGITIAFDRGHYIMYK